MCNSKNDSSFLIGMMVGGALGAVFGYLTAPAPGEDTRKKLAQTATKYYDEGKIQAQKAKESIDRLKAEAQLTAERAEGIYNEVVDEVAEIKEKVEPLIHQVEEASQPLRAEIKEKIGRLVEEVEEKVKEERKNSKKRMFSGVK